MAHNDNLDLIRELGTKLGMIMELDNDWRIIFPKNPKSRGVYAVMWKAYPLSQGRETQITVTIDYDENEHVGKVTLALPHYGGTERDEATFEASNFVEAVRKADNEANRFHAEALNQV